MRAPSPRVWSFGANMSTSPSLSKSAASSGAAEAAHARAPTTAADVRNSPSPWFTCRSAIELAFVCAAPRVAEDLVESVAVEVREAHVARPCAGSAVRSVEAHLLQVARRESCRRSRPDATLPSRRRQVEAVVVVHEAEGGTGDLPCRIRARSDPRGRARHRPAGADPRVVHRENAVVDGRRDRRCLRGRAAIRRSSRRPRAAGGSRAASRSPRSTRGSAWRAGLRGK